MVSYRDTNRLQFITTSWLGCKASLVKRSVILDFHSKKFEFKFKIYRKFAGDVERTHSTMQRPGMHLLERNRSKNSSRLSEFFCLLETLPKNASDQFA